MSADAFDDHNFVDVAPAKPVECYCTDAFNVVCPLHQTTPKHVPTSTKAEVATLERLATIESLLQDVLQRLPAPKVKTPKAKKTTDPALQNVVNFIQQRTGVPMRAVDKADLNRAIALHGVDAMAHALAAASTPHASSDNWAKAAQWLNRNLIASAAARCAQRDTKKPAVTTWKPPEDE